MKQGKTSTVLIFIGLMLVVVFVIGLACSRNPDVFKRRYVYDYTLDKVCAFCADWYIPAGIIGIPMLVISVLVSLAKDKKSNDS